MNHHRKKFMFWAYALHWRHNERDGDTNHKPRDHLLNHLFRHRSKKTSKSRVTDLCEANSPVTGEFPTHMASNAENVSIWWRHPAEAPNDVRSSASTTQTFKMTIVIKVSLAIDEY